MINKPKILIYQNEDTSLLIEYLQANDFTVVSKAFPGIEDALAEKDFDLCFNIVSNGCVCGLFG